MINHRNKQNYRLRTWNFRDRCHLKGGVRQGCFLSLILNYLIQYIHFRSLYITSHYYAKFKENPCVGTDARPPLMIFCGIRRKFYKFRGKQQNVMANLETGSKQLVKALEMTKKDKEK